MNVRLFCITGIVGAAPWAHSETTTFSVSPTPVALVDNGYTGTVGSMASVSLPIAFSGTIQDVNVTVGINHTWIGDLVIKIRSPSGTMVTLMSRPGVVETADDGTGTAGFGDSSDLSASFPITFDGSAASSAETMGSTLADSGVVCRDDSRCSYTPNPGAAAAGNLGSFNGQNCYGTWRLYVGDAGVGDTGTINQFSLTVVTPDRPRLQIMNSGTNIVVAWPTNAQGFTLEASPFVPGGGWVTVGGSTSVSGTNFAISLPATNVSRFFRIWK